MKTRFPIAMACLATATLVSATPPEISNVTAKQRYPWNGKVDITYTLTGDMTAVLPVVLFVTASNLVDNTTYVAVTSALSGDTGTAQGLHHVIWDMDAQGLRVKSTNVVFEVTYATAEYCVIDLSGGASALSYPISYLADVPVGGWPHEYKTTKLVLRLIEPGTFMMNGLYSTTLTKPFYCGVFEVTQKQYELVTGSNTCSSTSYGRGDNFPVHFVSYNMIRGSSTGAGWPGSTAVDGSSFLGKLRARTGIDFDLPTEAQWEYACRTGTTTSYSYGNDADGNYMVYISTSSLKSHVVGTKLPNAWGLYDMHGNVLEWCRDWYGSLSSGVTDPVGSPSGRSRVIRGGSWLCDADSCTSSYRNGLSPSGYNSDDGFRLVITLPNE